MTIEIRDLIAKLQQFDPTSKVTLRADAFEVANMKEGDAAMEDIDCLVERVKNTEEDFEGDELIKFYQETIAKIRTAIEIVGPIWEEMYAHKTASDQLDIVGVERSNTAMGVHAVIICEE